MLSSGSLSAQKHQYIILDKSHPQRNQPQGTDEDLMEISKAAHISKTKKSSEGSQRESKGS